MYDLMLRKATNPMFLLKIEDVWADIDQLCLNKQIESTQDFLKYSDFIDHFKLLENWVQAIAMPNSSFVRMLELDDVFMNLEQVTPLGYSRGESVFRRATKIDKGGQAHNDFAPIDDEDEQIQIRSN